MGAIGCSPLAGYYRPAEGKLSSPVGVLRRGCFFWHPRTGDAQGMDTRRYFISGSLGVKRANASRLGSNQTYKEV